MNEEWRQMVGHPKFLVSSKGRVSDRNGKIFAQRITKKGYATICLCENGEKFCIRVHREVAKAFLPLDGERDLVNHKDGNKTNNCVENLEWCTAKENSNHAYQVLGVKNEPRGEVPVVCVETGETYRSMSDASRKTGVARQDIHRCCVGAQKKAKGFHWKFANEIEVKKQCQQLSLLPSMTAVTGQSNPSLWG